MSSTASPEKQLVGNRSGRRVRPKAVTRFVFLAHRYLGIAVGLLMVLWCVSGIVMMYVPYPDLPQSEYRAGLSPIDLTDCCALPDAARPDLAGPISGFRIEALAGRPVLRLEKPLGRERVIDLSGGDILKSVDAATARAVAADFAARRGVAGQPAGVTRITQDQWTVNGAFDPLRPLYKVAFDDAAGTELYVSSRTGAVIQDTTASERFWNWLGSVPHWLYFTELRQNAELWTQIIIWTSLAGVFLTVTGIYAGIRQFRRGTSPYRGFAFWHHISGLAFGLLALTWVLSGLFSMNPWGLFQSDGAGAEQTRLQGAAPEYPHVAALVRNLASRDWDRPVVQLESARFGGSLYLIAHHENGERSRRTTPGLDAAPLAQSELADAARDMRPEAEIRSMELLHSEDAYYFSHPGTAPLPVFRVIYDDAESTRYYLDPTSGALRSKVDTAGRFHRWLFYGLHRLDFTAWLRARPVWDLVTLPLLLGATLVCATGAYMGVRWLFGRRRRGRRGVNRAV